MADLLFVEFGEGQKRDILRVGAPGTPTLGTPDPEVLRYLEFSQRILITDNRKSMLGHLEAHWAKGGHIWGSIPLWQKY